MNNMILEKVSKLDLLPNYYWWVLYFSIFSKIFFFNISDSASLSLFKEFRILSIFDWSSLIFESPMKNKESSSFDKDLELIWSMNWSFSNISNVLFNILALWSNKILFAISENEELNWFTFSDHCLKVQTIFLITTAKPKNKQMSKLMSCTVRLESSRLKTIFYRKSSAFNAKRAQTDDRSRSQRAELIQAMPAVQCQPVFNVLSTKVRKAWRFGTYAIDWRTVSKRTLMG